MKFTLVAAPLTEAVTLAEAKEQLRVTGTSEDALIQSYLDAALAQVDARQGVLGRALEPQTWELALSEPPRPMVRLRPGPVVSVISVTYAAEDGTRAILAPARYRLAEAMSEWVLAPVGGWPSFLSPDPGGGFPADLLTVRFKAGTGTPKDIRQAILMLVTHWYENRDGSASGEAGFPPGVRAILARHRGI